MRVAPLKLVCTRVCILAGCAALHIVAGGGSIADSIATARLRIATSAVSGVLRAKHFLSRVATLCGKSELARA